MTKYIFDDIIQIQAIFILIEQHFDDVEEQTHMKNVVRDTIHHKLLDMVLDELDTEKRMQFLYEVSDEDRHPSLLERLKNWIENVEDKIRLKAKEAEDEMLQLIEVS